MAIKFVEDPAKAEKPKRGFASMSQEKLREVSSRGGKSTAPDKRTFSTNKNLAVAAGKKSKRKKTDDVSTR